MTVVDNYFRTRLTFPYGLLNSLMSCRVLVTFLIMGPLFLALSDVHAATEPSHHDLKIHLFPIERRLAGEDRLRIHPHGSQSLSLSLSERASVLEVKVNGRPSSFGFRDGHLHVPLAADERQGVISLLIRYEAVFNDPIPVSPVNMDNPGYGADGVVSEKGCFLQSGAGWYPEVPGALATFSLDVDADEGMVAVSVGRPSGHYTGDGRTWSRWEVAYPLEGLSLSAAHYIVKEKALGGVKAMTYLLPESAPLAKAYLDATIKYIQFYGQLFGPYPFEKFAVVENFFETGYGFPSYTLLGSEVLRLPFIIHTSLGHEIAHSWWGNGVYVDLRQGNWSEALTTYVSDYLYKERASGEEAREYRLQVLRDFATLVKPQEDFPLQRFKGRYDRASQSIGYGKGAMVFHMLRKRLGENQFWDALRDVFKSKLFQKASWDDFQEAFERRGNCSLRRFFEQWITRKGAPKLALGSIRLERRGGSWQAKGTVLQERPFYDLDLILALKGRRGEVTRKIDVEGGATSFEIATYGSPEGFMVDPDFDTFRQLYPEEIPASINSVKASSSVLFVLGGKSLPEADRVANTLAESLDLKDFQIISEDQVKKSSVHKEDIVLIGLPQRTDLLPNLQGDITIENGRFMVHGESYESPSDIFFGVFPDPLVKGRFTALFLPLSMTYARDVARRLTHYGKYSYLTFRRGQNRDKGIWPVRSSPLIHEWDKTDQSHR
jgi:hypothetical protein